MEWESFLTTPILMISGNPGLTKFAHSVSGQLILLERVRFIYVEISPCRLKPLLGVVFTLGLILYWMVEMRILRADMVDVLSLIHGEVEVLKN